MATKDDVILVGSNIEDTHFDKKMLTMEDVSKYLQEEFLDEIMGAKKYLCAAKIANMAEDHHDCYYLLEMAKDEYTHATFIHNFMKEHKLNIPEDQEKCFIELKTEMAEFF